MQPVLEERGPFTVVGVMDRMTVNQAEQPAMWQNFTSRSQEIVPDKEVNARLGVFPEDGTGFALDVEMPYLAGCPVDEVESIPEGMMARFIPKAKYAVFTVDGDERAMTALYDKIFNEWLPKSGYKKQVADLLEWYPLTEGDTTQIQILVPVTNG